MNCSITGKSYKRRGSNNISKEYYRLWTIPSVERT